MKEQSFLLFLVAISKSRRVTLLPVLQKKILSISRCESFQIYNWVHGMSLKKCNLLGQDFLKIKNEISQFTLKEYLVTMWCSMQQLQPIQQHLKFLFQCIAVEPLLDLKFFLQRMADTELPESQASRGKQQGKMGRCQNLW